MSTGSFENMRLKLAGFVLEPEKPKDFYRLTVSGIVSFNEDTFDIRDLLLEEGKVKLVRQLPEALQMLEKESTCVTITMKKEPKGVVYG